VNGIEFELTEHKVLGLERLVPERPVVQRVDFVSLAEGGTINRVAEPARLVPVGGLSPTISLSFLEIFLPLVHFHHSDQSVGVVDCSPKDLVLNDLVVHCVACGVDQPPVLLVLDLVDVDSCAFLARGLLYSYKVN